MKKTILGISIALTSLLGISIASPTVYAQGATIEYHENTYVAGEGYDTLRGITYGNCASQCLADNSCAMIEFYRPENKCNLFRHSRTAGWSRDAVVGIKRAAAPVPPPSRAGHMRRLANSYVVGKGYDTITRSTVQDCEDYCLGDRQCRMMEFFRPENKCNLYSHRNTRQAEGSAALVSVKE